MSFFLSVSFWLWAPVWDTHRRNHACNESLMQGANRGQMPQRTHCISFVKCVWCVFQLYSSTPLHVPVKRYGGQMVILSSFIFLSGTRCVSLMSVHSSTLPFCGQPAVSEGTEAGTGWMLNLRTSNKPKEDTEINRGRRSGDLMGRWRGHRKWALYVE